MEDYGTACILFRRAFEKWLANKSEHMNWKIPLYLYYAEFNLAWENI